MRFVLVANFIRFPGVQNVLKSLRFDRVADILKVGTFLRRSVDDELLTNSTVHDVCFNK